MLRCPLVVVVVAGCCSAAPKISPLSRSDPWCPWKSTTHSRQHQHCARRWLLVQPCPQQGTPVFVEAKTCRLVSAALRAPLAFFLILPLSRSLLSGLLSASNICPHQSHPPQPSAAEHALHLVQVKNRESAARSRQRKQAYTSELEEKVEQLQQQNADLLQKVGCLVSSWPCLAGRRVNLQQQHAHQLQVMGVE